MMAVLGRVRHAGALGWAGGLVQRLLNLVRVAIAVLLALTPVTAILVLGWLVRVMRREVIIEVLRRGRKIGRKPALAAIAASSEFTPYARFPGWWSGLWDTIRQGLMATVVVAALTLPFGLLMLVSWWAGWENSFNKGYEQAWVGPVLALFGALAAVAILTHAPMAFSAFATEGRLAAAFELRRIRRLMSAVRWRYLLLTVSSVILMAPLFLAQILPTFVEQINPKLAGADAATIKAFANRWHLLATVYLVLVALVLRRWAARLYARAVLTTGGGGSEFVNAVAGQFDIRLDNLEPPRRSRVGMVLSTVFVSAAWLGFLAMLYIAQFANHAWWSWVNHPLLALPWIFRPM
ncbi:MAG: hypothetical protein ACR2PA_22745 [Hyphomicrobiaceae bacterium]